MTKKTSTAKSKIAQQVQFELLAPEAGQVFLAGDFNNWDTEAHPMKKDKNGKWKTTLTLGPGRYEYRFFADSSWQNDPVCSACVTNKFGSRNCVKVVE